MPASRRDFLKGLGLAGTALVLGFRLEPGRAGEAAAPLRPDGWLAVGRDGRVTVVVGRSEMGQGVRTALPMIAAEELEVPMASVDLAQAEPGPAFPDLGTGGSTSVERLWQPLRRSAAAARALLVAAAAAQWGVDPGRCRAAAGWVLGPGGRRLPYGRLVVAAARLPVPPDPPLKPAAAFTLLGRPARRVDGPRLVDGSARYGLDQRLPGMKRAVVARCPVFGGRPKGWNAAKVLARPGVRAVVPIASGLAVVADDSWQALAAVADLEPVWEEGPAAGFSSDGFRSQLDALLAEPGAPARVEGDPDRVLAQAARRLEARYEFPWQAHAPMEPPNAVADVRPNGCDVWTGCQEPNGVQKLSAQVLGLPESAVRVHVPLLGGGFGRRLRSDYAAEAVELSRALGGPVQVLWSRRDDLQHDFYHPMSVHRLEAALEDGSLAAWRHRVAAPSRALGPGGRPTPRSIRAETNGAADLPYRIPHLAVEYAGAECPVPLGAWRAIQAVPNLFARECFLDEVAAALGRDPLALRLDLLGPGRVLEAGGARADTGRLRRVLELAADRAGWGRPLPAGRGRGLACGTYEGRTHVAQVAEVSVGPGGALRVHRVVAAVDCGLVVNPLGAAGQVESAVVWALSALRTRITFRGGRAEQGSMADLPLWTLAETPAIEVHFLDGDDAPTGLGEPPVPPVIPAVLNALHAATGRRVRTLPFVAMV